MLLENQNTTIEVLRDRNSTFEPIIVPKHEKRISLFNDQIISMYSFGMSDKQIREHLEKVYNIDVSADLISRVTNEVLEEVSPTLLAQTGKTAHWKNPTPLSIWTHYGLKAARTAKVVIRAFILPWGSILRAEKKF